MEGAGHPVFVLESKYPAVHWGEGTRGGPVGSAYLTGPDTLPPMSEPRPVFVPVATLSDVMTARITVARLESEGIPAKVHGEGLGPYRLTVGDFAATEIWVAEDRVDDAREVLMAAEIDAMDDPTIEDDAGPRGMTGAIVGAALLLLVVAYRVLAAVT
jgi:hypothetical protein